MFQFRLRHIAGLVFAIAVFLAVLRLDNEPRGVVVVTATGLIAGALVGRSIDWLGPEVGAIAGAFSLWLLLFLGILMQGDGVPTLQPPWSP